MQLRPLPYVTTWLGVFPNGLPQNPGADFLCDYSNNKSFGVSDEKTIRNALLALYTNECVEAFKAAGLTDP